MPKSIDDLFEKITDSESKILDKVDRTSEKLGDRLGAVEVEVASIGATVKAHGREIGGITRRFEDHLNREPTGVVNTPAPRAPESRGSIPPKLDKKMISIIKTYAALGAFVAGLVLTALSLLGIIH